MKREDILAALHDDPDAVFALRPGPSDSALVQIRGLKPSHWTERWTFREFRRPEHDRWVTASSESVVLSREIVRVEDAVRVVDARAEEHRARLRELAEASEVAARLQALGIAAAQIHKHVVVQTPDKLAQLLDRLDHAHDEG